MKFVKFGMATKTKVEIDKLNNSNYKSWSYQLTLLLRKEKCFSAIEDDVPPKTVKLNDVDTRNPAYEKWNEANDNALFYVGTTIDINQQQHIRQLETAKQAWEKLKKIHSKSALWHKVQILKNLFKMEMLTGNSMQEHLDKMFGKFEELAGMGCQYTDEISVAIIFASLSAEYDNVITAMETWDDDKLTAEAVRSKLLDEWERQNERNQKTESAMKVRQNEYSGRKDMRQLPCFNCRKMGHIARFCPDAKKEKDEKASLAMNSKSEYALTSSSAFSDGWYLDSGATIHIANNINCFIAIDWSQRQDIITASGEKLVSKGIGTVEIDCSAFKFEKDGKMTSVVKIHDVLYVPNASSNLLSVRKLTAKGFVVKFFKNVAIVTKEGRIHVSAELKAGMYCLKENQRIMTVTSKNQEFCIHEWHHRLAHRNISDIKKMEVYGLKIKSCKCLNDCEACLKGKMSRKPFPKKAHEIENALDVIVSDVCGPFQEKTIAGKRYFVTFIDVCSRYSYVYFINKKSEVLEKFKHFLKKIERFFGIGKLPRFFRTDRGGEYIGEEFKRFLEANGITHQKTVAYSPEQNGICERKNRTLVEAARTMLIESKLPKRLWAEAVNTANYIQNRLINRVTGTIPYEKWFGKKPEMLDLHPFGCEVYVHIPKEKRRKLDEKAEKKIFVGYDEESKGYRIYDYAIDNIVPERNVKFLSITRSKSPEISTEEIDCFELEFGNIEEANGTDEAVEEQEDVFESAEENEEPAEELRRSTRSNFGVPPSRFNNYIQAIQQSEEKEPKSYEETMKSKENGQWKAAMQEELKSIQQNDTWDLVDLPKGRKAIGSKWVFKKKCDAAGKVTRYKARLVAQGFNQKFGVDYDEVFAPVARQTTFRILMSVSGAREYIVKHYDVKTAFLNGKISEDIYMKQPPGFKIGDKVCKLKKGLYGLKQSARAWNKEVKEVLVTNGYKQSQADQCLYLSHDSNEKCYVLVHVDDFLFAAESECMIDKIVKQIKKRFEIKDLGPVSQFLGIQVNREDAGNFYINQATYIDKICEESGQQFAKPSKIPLDAGYEKITNKTVLKELEEKEEYQKLIGMLLYVSVNSRPDISASVSILAQHVGEPTREDMIETKRLIRYLKGTRDMRLALSNVDKKDQNLVVYSDANWAENRSDRKSNSGYIAMLNGGTISWACRKQSCVSLSSTEAEYIALAEACQEVIWLQRLCEDFEISIEKPTTVNVDNQSCMSMVEREKFSNRTKHVDTKYHFVQDMKEKGDILLKYCPTEENIADMMTKPLQNIKISKHRTLANIQ